MSRKRKNVGRSENTSGKRRKTSGSASSSDGAARRVHHELLSCYYPRVLTLRHFLLARLPQSSGTRRRRVADFDGAPVKDGQTGSFLDTTLVGILDESNEAVEATRLRDLAVFTQSTQRGGHSGHSGHSTGPVCSMAEIVSFAIWKLFHRSDRTTWRPHHLLCHGFQKAVVRRNRQDEAGDLCSVPDVVLEHPNDNVQTLKKPPWEDIAILLGKDAHRIITSLLLDCGIFVQLHEGRGNYYQLSGIPISDLPELASSRPTGPVRCVPVPPAQPVNEPRKPNDVVLVRSRMLYAKPSTNAQGGIRFGLKHIHVFNRYTALERHDHTVHVLKHIFPRQFGLHNVWTSSVKATETSQPFQDYTLREHEIHTSNVKLPKRLRGAVLAMVRKMRHRHQKCPYAQLLRHYCPSSGHGHGHGHGHVTHASTSTVVHATPTRQVSAFCRSVLCFLLPSDTMGKGSGGHQNRAVLLEYVDRFVCMRRYESMSLHQLSQRIKVTDIDWLWPPNVTPGSKLSPSDRSKRLDILREFLYYLFDSILIPLIRSHFYVTESGSHRNCLFYFRHDVWSRIAEPSFHHLTVTMFEGLRPEVVRKVLHGRSLGISNMRLLPKTHGTRPIINLRRRSMKTAYGRTTLGPSINAQLQPVFDALNYERSCQPGRLGSAMFSVGDMHERLLAFKRRLRDVGTTTFYFVKLDIQSCFDTIPHEALLRLAQRVMEQPQYRVTRHLEVKLADTRGTEQRQPVRKFVNNAYPVTAQSAFSKAAAEELARQKHQVIFNDTGRQRVWDAGRLQQLLQEHVQNNIVKVGQQHFRQHTGIPQGSVLSSLLCSFFYGAFEQQHLAFLHDTSSLLTRLVDDFLLITTDEGHARRFLQVMADGNADYGISIHARKTLTNLDATVHGVKVPRHHGSFQFPYCGLVIDMQTLEISRDREKKDWQVSNALTVEFHRRPGQVFRRRVLMAFKTQLYAMLLDPSLNSMRQVAITLHQNFTETAMKMHRYISSLPRAMRPAPALIIEVIQDLIHLAVHLVRSKLRGRMVEQHARRISRSQMSWLAADSVERTLTRKQTAYRLVLVWLVQLKQTCQKDMTPLGSVVAERHVAFQQYVY